MLWPLKRAMPNLIEQFVERRTSSTAIAMLVAIAGPKAAISTIQPSLCATLNSGRKSLSPDAITNVAGSDQESALRLQLSVDRLFFVECIAVVPDHLKAALLRHRPHVIVWWRPRSDKDRLTNFAVVRQLF